MHEHYIQLLEQSFNRAQHKVGLEALSSFFFSRFFNIYPETQTFFENTDIDYFKRKKITIIFSFCIDIIKHPDFSQGRISEEIIRHQIYGLNDKVYYFTLIDCLSTSIKAALGDDWKPEYQEVWYDISLAFKSSINEAASDFLSH